MFQRIRVPLDGSTRAEQAIPLAAHLAWASGGTVILVAVLDVVANSVATLAAASTETFDHQCDDVDAYLAGMSAREDLAGVPTEREVAKGVVAETLLTVALARGADLIVLSSHGRTGLSRWALGSVAEQLVRQASMPVLMLREPIPVALTSGGAAHSTRPLRVLVPLDGSPLAESALRPATLLLAALAPPQARMLHLTRVVGIFPTGGQTLLDSLMASVAWQEAHRYLLATTERLQGGELAPLQVQISWSLTTSVDEAAAIVNVAETGEKLEGSAPPGGCDLIAMAVQHRHISHGWAFGSVASRVPHGTRLPTLIVPTAGPASAAQHERLPDVVGRAR